MTDDTRTYRATIDITIQDDLAQYLHDITGIQPPQSPLGGPIPTAHATITLTTQATNPRQAIALALQEGIDRITP